MNLDLYKKYAEQVRNNAYKDNYFHGAALELIAEINHAQKYKRNLSWYWLNRAKNLFDIFNIEDENISVDMIKDEISFTYKKKKYKTKILLTKNWQNNGEHARLSLNADGMEDEEFVIKTICGYIDRNIEVDTTKVYLHYNYIALLVKGYKRCMSKDE